MADTSEVKQLLAETFGVSAEDVPDDAEIGSLERWDSLGHLELMIAIEAHFGLKLPARVMLELNTLPKLVQYLQAAN